MCSLTNECNEHLLKFLYLLLNKEIQKPGGSKQYPAGLAAVGFRVFKRCKWGTSHSYLSHVSADRMVPSYASPPLDPGVMSHTVGGLTLTNKCNSLCQRREDSLSCKVRL